MKHSLTTILAIILPAILSASYHYDVAGRLEHNIQQNGVIVSYSYDPEGNIVAVARPFSKSL